MLNGLVIAVPTYNTLEYLRLFIKSYERFASRYPLVVVSDGATDGTEPFIKEHSFITGVLFEQNLGKPFAYNTCFKAAIELCGAKYVLLLNDDTVLGPNWDYCLEKWVDDLDRGSVIKLNFAEPFIGGSADAFFDGGSTPDLFNFESWVSFEKGIHSKFVSGDVRFVSGGPEMLYMVSSDVVKRHHFDTRFYVPSGCQDADLFLRLWLNGHKIFRLKDNVIFHFSSGANRKIRAAGKWVESDSLFVQKWGIRLGTAVAIFNNGLQISDTELCRLKEISEQHRFDTL